MRISRKPLHRFLRGGLSLLVLWSLCAAGPLAAQGYSRTETIEYQDDVAGWVLGQVRRSTTNGIETHRTDYNPQSLPIATFAFGKLQQRLSYHPDGTVASVSDGNGNVTGVGYWKRGIPQSISHADGSSQTLQVNDHGWITALTDETGSRTCYGYDAMGRINQVTYPSETQAGVCDGSQWAATSITFEQVNYEEYGLSAGHWRQSIRTGNHRKFVFFDALWRPVVEQEDDVGAQQATLRWSAKRYDHNGRVVFAAYPRNPHVQGWTTFTDGSLTGVWTTYDALGRPTVVGQDSEHGRLNTITSYNPGFTTTVTNPRGFQTSTSYMTYDQPSMDWPVGISAPLGATTGIARDVFGKPTLITRSGPGVSVSRHYVYDVHQQLCKSIEPETGATVVDYDAAGNLAWSASGLHGGSYATTASCSRSEASGSGRSIGRAYDARNRIVGLWTPDGRGNQSWQYTPDGLVSQSVVDNDGPGIATVVNAYSYNKRRLLVGESQSQPGWYTWSIGYGYNANAHRVYTHYPDGFHSTRHVNALGQETLIDSAWGVLASNITWHPNGAIKSFTYGNGIAHETQLNARQLPSRRSDAGITNYNTAYDANGNPDVIYDDLRGHAFSRWMQYDGLDRLTAAGSASFGGDHWHRFGYDALDNLKSWTLAGVKDYAHYDYDSAHRLTNIRNSAGATVVGLAYDAQGNLANKNGQGYHFDYLNRLRAAAGHEHYRYDSHGRRVLGWSPTSGNILAMYANDGSLLFQQDQRRGYNIPHVYLGGRLLARVEWSWHGAADSGIKYQHTDALGSPVATTNGAAQLVERIEYEPFGAMIGKANDDKPRYTGHVMDSATGLVYMQQRYYDPQLGVFLSVDPVTAYSNPIGQFHRYRYANNNPYAFTDPDGRAAILAYPLVIGGRCALSSACRTAVKTGAKAVVATVIALAGSEAINMHNESQESAPGNGGNEPDFTDTDGNKPPFTGEPGSTVRGGTGSRTYGEDGYPETDRDTPHPDEKGTGNRDHVHDWGRPAGGGPPRSEDRGPSRDPKPGDPPQPRGPNVPPPDKIR